MARDRGSRDGGVSDTGTTVARAPGSDGSESSATNWAEIFVVSDGTGQTAADAVRACMLQFQNPWRMRTFSDVRSPSQARHVIEEADHANAVVVFTVVNKIAARALLDRGAERGVPTVDLLGPLISNVSEHLHAEPRHQPGLLHGFSDDYFRRIEAVEFAVRHDDGANLHTLFQADIVLTGVSRTSKTPLSMYLAQRGYKTGNVPLIPDMEPPRELVELDPSKVIGLVMDPDTLLQVRQARARLLGATPRLRYADPEGVLSEVQEARRLFRARGWRVVDISGRAVEENAARVVDVLERGRAAR